MSQWTSNITPLLKTPIAIMITSAYVGVKGVILIYLTPCFPLSLRGVKGEGEENLRGAKPLSAGTPCYLLCLFSRFALVLAQL